jgi:outer membrane protein assembly factor BamE (lipoprotein component of BamABCDE complex)
MNLLRILTVAAAGATLVGCATTDSNSNPGARAKVSQLHEGMSQGQVARLFGQPNKVDHDDGDHYHGAYIPYYGWHHRGSGGEELTWEYKNPKLEVKFRRGSSGGWVVREWDLD